MVAGMPIEAGHDNQIPNQVGDDGKWLILWGYVMDNLENLHNFAAWEFKLRQCEYWLGYILRNCYLLCCCRGGIVHNRYPPPVKILTIK